MTDETNKPITEIAKAVLLLTYAEMMEFAGILNMLSDDVEFDLSSDNGWADLLLQWADNEVSGRA